MFRRRFGGTGAVRIAVAPGRVNLIGEHTDYNDGFVLPMAIERHIAIAFTRSSGREIRVWSDHFQEEANLAPDGLEPGRIAGWAAYPAGMCWAMQSLGHSIGGMQAVVVADIPVGAGVSSSAALEVSFGLALSEANGLDLSPAEIAGVSHRADNDFVGIPSGIMDQYASALCRQGNALLIDCRTTDSELVSIRGDVVFVVMDTGKRRGLVDSAYADRVNACRRVVEIMRRRRPEMTALRDVTMEDLHQDRPYIDAVDYQRAMHVIAENERTLAAVDRFRSDDAEGFGALMVASHHSLRDLYEVSCPELDAAVSAALEHSGCLGARMTGGGFGGCALALVSTDSVNDFLDYAARSYAMKTDLQGAFFSVRAADGVRLATT